MQSPSKHLFSSRNVVSGIVRRWHAMKVLFNLYCNSSVRNSYLESYIPYPGRDPESGQDGMPSKNDPLAPPSGDICDDFKKLTPEQKNRTYERFYKVLTAHWVAVEFAWLSKIRIYKDFAERDRFHDEVTEMWTRNDDRSVQEKLALKLSSLSGSFWLGRFSTAHLLCSSGLTVPRIRFRSSHLLFLVAASLKAG
ncbi:hypothetical protein AWENTII_006274 [Aspergillus wentii]